MRLGQEHGYRNAQATVLAPTGTIGLLMDCDTTGIEPDFALVKFKKLAGGGYFKIVNQSVPEALQRLGYSPAEVQEIVAYVCGTNTLLAAPHVNRASLKAARPHRRRPRQDRGGAPRRRSSSISPSARGSSAKRRTTRLGVPDEQARAPGFSLLKYLGFSRAEIDEANDVIIGRMTIEGAPHLRPEHYSVFDCANRCGKTGQRFLAPMSHVRMMAAAQPFLSGAISKTVNLPNEATVDDVREIYEEGWRLGLKAVALYRDGCKASQPLSTSSKENRRRRRRRRRSEPTPAASRLPAARPRARRARRRCPSHRHARAPAEEAPRLHPGGQGRRAQDLPPHGRIRATAQLGEIFIDMHKEGAAFRSLMNCFAMAVSVGLQYGVPLETFVEQFTFTRFEPQGLVEGHPTSSSRRRSSTTSSACSASSTCSATTSRRSRPPRR